MPDVLSPAERAAIAAFPEARVQRVPRGVSGLGTFIYDPLASGQLRPTVPCGWREQIRAETLAVKRDRHNRRRRAAVLARHELVKALLSGGKTIPQMAAHLGVSACTISNDLREIRGTS